MGAINYGSNNILNIGYNLKDYDYEEDWDFCEDDYNQVKWELERHNFNYFNIELKGGYYEGFYLDLEFKFLWLDNYNEKLEALKEATKLRKLLEKCIYDYNMVVYYPGWCTGYEDKKTSLKMVKNAIKEQKHLIKGLYTEKTLTTEKWKELVGIGR